MIVCIAEKPSVAREIAHIIGAKAKKDGYFEGNGYAVTWTFGHFCTLKSPDDYQPDWKRWDLNTLPMLPEKFETKLMNDKGVKKQFAVIRQLFKDAEYVINCGDAGQEGELIQRWVMKQAKYKGKVLRLWISSLTPEAIREGFQNLKNASNYDNLFYAGSSRAIGDWLLGMNATRLYTLKYGGFKQVLSIGRVQTPTLAMLVDRYLEIENFKPEPYWELQTVYREVTFSCEQGRFQKKEEGEALLLQVEGKPFVVLSSVRKEGREYPPSLFDLTGLQVHCNKRFGFSADTTLKIVQKLYEQKVVTYPRVDTTYLPNDVYPKIPAILGNMTSYSQFTQPLLGKKLRKSGKVFNDSKVTDHHAIIPTGFEKGLAYDEQKVYDAIARQFIAVFYPDCLVANTTVIGEVDGVKFKATGKEILDEGWRLLFPKPAKKSGSSPVKEEESDDDDHKEKKEDEENIMPEFKTGETGSHEPVLTEKQTQPPKHFTEATLLRAMETAGKKVDDEELRDLMKANGIGRPSTRANIIETLFKRGYIERRKKLVMATSTGIQLIQTIDNQLLKSAELTGQWEKQLREIESGTHSAAKFIGDMKTMVGELVEEVRMAAGKPRISSTAAAPEGKSSRRKAPPKSNRSGSDKVEKNAKKSGVRHAEVAGLACPKCRDGKLLKGKSACGCSRWQEGCGFRLPFVFMDKVIPEAQLARLIKSGSTIQIRGFKTGGKSKAGKLRWNDNFELLLDEKTTPGKKVAAKKAAPKKQAEKKAVLTCPKCGEGTVLKGKTAYGCSRWQEGCDWRFSFAEVLKQVNGRKATKELVTKILRKAT